MLSFAAPRTCLRARRARRRRWRSKVVNITWKPVGVSLQFHGFRFHLVYGVQLLGDQNGGSRPRRDPAAWKGRVLLSGTHSESDKEIKAPVCKIHEFIVRNETQRVKRGFFWPCFTKVSIPVVLIAVFSLGGPQGPPPCMFAGCYLTFPQLP